MAAISWAVLLLAFGGWVDGLATKQKSVAKDPSDVCLTPVLELQNLTHVELREYHKTETKVSFLTAVQADFGR